MKSKKKKENEEEPLFESNEYFAMIIGYTSGGCSLWCDLGGIRRNGAVYR